MKKLKCRFGVDQIQETKDNEGNVTQETVEMSAVSASGDKYEYEYPEQERAERDIQSFADATPWGEFRMQVDNAHALGFLKPGKHYYITIEEVPAELQQ